MTTINLHDYLDRVSKLLDESRLGEVTGHCRHILDTYPQHIDTYRVLAKALLEKESYDDARNMFLRILSANPCDFIANVGLSIIFKEESLLPQALWHLERAFEAQPYNAAIQAELRDLYQRSGLPVPPRLPLTVGALARLHLKSEMYQQAAMDLRRELKQHPDRMDLAVLLAETLWRANQRVDAVEVCRQILEELPNCIVANAILAEIWLVTGRIREAKPYLQKVQHLTQIDQMHVDAESAVGRALTADGATPLPENVTIDHLDREAATELDSEADWVSEATAVEDTDAPASYDWLAGISLGDPTEPAQPEAETAVDEASSEWFIDVEPDTAVDGPESEPVEPVEAEAPALEEEDEADWLLHLDEAPPIPADATESPTFASDSFDWLNEEEAPVEETESAVLDLLGDDTSAASEPAPTSQPETSVDALADLTGIDALQDDMPDWLSDATDDNLLLDPSEAQGWFEDEQEDTILDDEEATAAPPVVEEIAAIDNGDDEEQAPDWLLSATSGEDWLSSSDDAAADETPAELEPEDKAKAGAAEVPDWLLSTEMDEDALTLLAETSAKKDQTLIEDLFDDIDSKPGWLNDEPESEETAVDAEAAVDTTESEAVEVPNWLQDDMADSPTPLEDPVTPEPEDIKPDEPTEPTPEPAPDEDTGELEDAMAWLEDLASSQLDEEEAFAQPEAKGADDSIEDEPELVDWLAASAEDAFDETAVATSADEMPDWLQNMAPAEQTSTDEPGEEEDEDWLTVLSAPTGDILPVDEPPTWKWDQSEAGTTPDDGIDDAMAVTPTPIPPEMEDASAAKDDDTDEEADADTVIAPLDDILAAPDTAVAETDDDLDWLEDIALEQEEIDPGLPSTLNELDSFITPPEGMTLDEDEEDTQVELPPESQPISPEETLSITSLLDEADFPAGAAGDDASGRLGNLSRDSELDLDWLEGLDDVETETEDVEPETTAVAEPESDPALLGPDADATELDEVPDWLSAFAAETDDEDLAPASAEESPVPVAETPEELTPASALDSLDQSEQDDLATLFDIPAESTDGEEISDTGTDLDFLDLVAEGEELADELDLFTDAAADADEEEPDAQLTTPAGADQASDFADFDLFDAIDEDEAVLDTADAPDTVVELAPDPVSEPDALDFAADDLDFLFEDDTEDVPLTPDEDEETAAHTAVREKTGFTDALNELDNAEAWLNDLADLPDDIEAVAADETDEWGADELTAVDESEETPVEPTPVDELAATLSHLEALAKERGTVEPPAPVTAAPDSALEDALDYLEGLLTPIEPPAETPVADDAVDEIDTLMDDLMADEFDFSLGDDTDETRLQPSADVDEELPDWLADDIDVSTAVDGAEAEPVIDSAEDDGEEEDPLAMLEGLLDADLDFNLDEDAPAIEPGEGDDDFGFFGMAPPPAAKTELQPTVADEPVAAAEESAVVDEIEPVVEPEIAAKELSAAADAVPETTVAEASAEAFDESEALSDDEEEDPLAMLEGLLDADLEFDLDEDAPAIEPGEGDDDFGFFGVTRAPAAKTDTESVVTDEPEIVAEELSAAADAVPETAVADASAEAFDESDLLAADEEEDPLAMLEGLLDADLEFDLDEDAPAIEPGEGDDDFGFFGVTRAPDAAPAVEPGEPVEPEATVSPVDEPTAEADLPTAAELDLDDDVLDDMPDDPDEVEAWLNQLAASQGVAESEDIEAEDTAVVTSADTIDERLEAVVDDEDQVEPDTDLSELEPEEEEGIPDWLLPDDPDEKPPLPQSGWLRDLSELSADSWLTEQEEVAASGVDETLITRQPSQTKPVTGPLPAVSTEPLAPEPELSAEDSLILPADSPPASALAADSEDLETARNALASGELTEALSAYRVLLEKGSGLGLLIADLETAVENHPQQPAVRRLLGDAYMRNGQLQRALEVYRQALDQL